MNDIASWVSLGVSVLISIGAGIGAAAIYLGRYKEKVTVLEGYKKRVEDLETFNTQLAEKVQQLEKREEKANEKINQLCSDMAVQQSVTSGLQRDIDKNSGIAQAHSPLALTDKGWDLVKDSGAMDIYDTIKDELVAELELQEPRSQYDVQEKARWMMGQKFDDDRFSQVEDWAYKNGADFSQILRSLGLPLRDYYFEKHPDIVNPKEIY